MKDEACFVSRIEVDGIFCCLSLYVLLRVANRTLSGGLWVMLFDVPGSKPMYEMFEKYIFISSSFHHSCQEIRYVMVKSESEKEE